MTKLFKALVFAIPLMTQTYVWADDAELLRARLTDMSSLRAEFQQTVMDVNQKLIQQGSGVFALAYPNQFYWHLTAPDESLIVADGTELWIYNPFAEEVTLMDMDQAIQASPIALLVHRDAQTWAQYDVSRDVSDDDPAHECFAIRPKATDTSVQAVNLCFEAKLLTDFRIEDEQGNLSRFRLSEQRPMQDSEMALFHFSAPADVDIDDQRRNPEVQVKQ
ncbi:outer membrane lipoprotein chaperone LolA [Shewanella salipaludis]